MWADEVNYKNLCFRETYKMCYATDLTRPLLNNGCRLQGKKPSKGKKGLVKRKAVTATDADGPVAENGHVHTKRHKTVQVQ